MVNAGQQRAKMFLVAAILLSISIPFSVVDAAIGVVGRAEGLVLPIDDPTLTNRRELLWHSLNFGALRPVAIRLSESI